ncbi:MAG: hypothetical protein ABSG62_07120 [Terracidiphilus sp.]|jgi:adenosylhomocysteine nucleosidase
MVPGAWVRALTRVAIIAAMAGELKPLVRGWPHERRNGVDVWRWKSDGGEWVAACAGAGVDAATRAFAEIERDGAFDQVISIGWAGALGEEFKTGKAYWVAGAIDARTGERFRTQAWEDESVDSHPIDKNKDVARVGHPDLFQSLVGHPDLSQSLVGHPDDCWLVTSARVADRQEKRRLAATYRAGIGVGLVDMEAAGVARLAQMRGIAFYCIKGVSDGVRDQLPDFNRFISANGRFQLARFVLFVLLRPWYWLGLMRMGENSRKAAQAMRESLLENLDGRGAITRRNGYPNLKR